MYDRCGTGTSGDEVNYLYRDADSQHSKYLARVQIPVLAKSLLQQIFLDQFLKSFDTLSSQVPQHYILRWFSHIERMKNEEFLCKTCI